jgi:nucleotide-binding universal stress UspA family protein
LAPIKIDPRTAAAFVGEGMTSAMIESVIDLAEKDGEKRRQAAHSQFKKICDKEHVPIIEAIADRPLSGASAQFVEKQGNREEVLLMYGRLFDLIVVSKLKEDEDGSHRLMINTALRETGRPVLLVEDTVEETVGSKIALAWNGSVESSRAIFYALPLLRNAQSVTLISAVDDLDEEVHSEDAIRYLALHGISAKSCEITGGSGKSTAESLLAQATKCDADLLVMGAYTRSRLRRLFFGAVTEEILESCPIPVLLAH